MRPLNPKDILRRVKKEGFENVWRDSPGLLPRSNVRLKIEKSYRGVSHPLYDLIQRLRQSFLDLGFTEISNPVIVDENEIYKQYGPEAPIILDRCYYLATLPRPDIGLSTAKYEEIEKVGVKLTEDKVSALQKVLRDYKKGEVDSDDFVEKMSEALEVPDTLAMHVVSEVFPEFSILRPEPSSLTLRSHMTSAWFPTLQALQQRVELPLKLFSVDIRFRREQREDPTHLRAHHAASCVVMDEAIDVRDGEEITEAVLKPLGFEKFRFEKKKVTSKYYAPGMEYEGFVFHSDVKRWIEVVDYGLYSPIALARYDLEYPVLNVGIGVERIAMTLYKEDDVRRLVYPQFYTEFSLSDADIARMIRVEVEPKTSEGERIKQSILLEASKNAEAPSPCEFQTYEGTLLGKKVKVYLYQRDVGVRLLGAATENHVFVHDGNILGIPLKGMDDVDIVRDAREKGFSTGIRYIDGISSLAAAMIEEAVENGQDKTNLRIRMAKRPRDINIRISDIARRYVTNQKKKIDISGPLFIGIRAEINQHQS